MSVKNPQAGLAIGGLLGELQWHSFAVFHANFVLGGSIFVTTVGSLFLYFAFQPLL